MALQAANMPGLVASTLEKLEKTTWTNLTVDLQNFIVYPMLSSEKRMIVGTGRDYGWEMNFGSDGNFRWTGLYETDTVNVNDGLVRASVPWRHLTYGYAFDEREEDMNSGPEAVVNLVMQRESNERIKCAENLETWFFSNLSSSDTASAYPFTYWVPGTNLTEGFNTAALLSGFTDKAGVSPTTYPRWAPWTNSYTAVTKADLITKMRRASRKTFWRAPVRVPENLTDYDNMVVCNIDTISAFEDLGEAQNENLGRDLASMDGMMMYHRNPVVYVPALDSFASDPVWMIDWSSFKFIVRGNFDFKRTVQEKLHGQHTVTRVFEDLSCNTCCRDLRRQALIAKSTF